jgi:Uma2 family endonuclease
MTLTKQRLWTVEEYHRMIDAGILTPIERVELIEGQIIEVSPQKPPHASTVSGASDYLRSLLGSKAIVRVQLPITLEPSSEPEPDIAIVSPDRRKYKSSHPTLSDIYLVIEVADATLVYDQYTKSKMYADANIVEYWIIDISEHRLIVCRNPEGGVYRAGIYLTEVDTVTLLAFPNVTVNVAELLP